MNKIILFIFNSTAVCYATGKYLKYSYIINIHIFIFFIDEINVGGRGGGGGF